MDGNQQTTRIDLYQRVTDEIVKAIEAGAGKYIMPWHGVLRGRPRNPHTGHAYQGINTLALWATARNRGYVSIFWATYRQWREMGAKVRAGEKATMVILYKPVPVDAQDAETGELVQDYRFVMRQYYVFNAVQVEGWVEPNRPVTGLIASHQEIENFIAATGADIRTGDAAAYWRSGDYITIPDKCRFVGSDSTTVTESYYSTIFHELVHWTGHWMRLDRNLSGRFGDHDYAMEELVAELGAAYLCSEFFVLHLPRSDHAAYIATWLDVLRTDKRAVFSASIAASRAVRFLLHS